MVSKSPTFIFSVSLFSSTNFGSFTFLAPFVPFDVLILSRI
nr:MAG TPA: hypothetical protein [Caudoviricetes sp.]